MSHICQMWFLSVLAKWRASASRLGHWALNTPSLALIILLVEFSKITLVGVGLLGGSIGLAVKQRGLSGHVCGLVRREESISECINAGVVDEATLDTATAIEDAKLVILCTQVGQMQALSEQLKPHLADDAIVTDVGSVKAKVVVAIDKVIPRFVGSHPLAGSEKTGVSNARADLLDGALCPVTPTEQSDTTVVGMVEKFWQALGLQTTRLSPEMHDVVVARTSHLPHILATALVRCVLDSAHNNEANYCSTGFRDTTRLAGGSASLWRDIALANPDAIDAAVSEFQKELDELRVALKAKDAKALEQFFNEGSKLRGDWLRGME